MAAASHASGVGKEEAKGGSMDARRKFIRQPRRRRELCAIMDRAALSSFTWATPIDPATIDFRRPFIPWEFCPFTHLPGAATLPPEILLRQNQLHALCGLELIQLFEWSGRQALAPLARKFAGTPLGGHIVEFIEEERRHSAQFATLCRAAAPALYARGEHWFVRVPGVARSLAGFLLARPRLVPLWPWMMLVQEEKALHISRAYLRAADAIEPHFVAVHRLHAADEAHHIGWDEDLIDALWADTPRWWRRCNASALAWLLSEFFLAPKRAGVRLVEQLRREFPDHSGALHSLLPGLAALGRNPDWQRSAYSREMLPRTLERMAHWPEFSSCRRGLVAASPQPA
jgi:hypothetical protein